MIQDNTLANHSVCKQSLFYYFSWSDGSRSNYESDCDKMAILLFLKAFMSKVIIEGNINCDKIG